MKIQSSELKNKFQEYIEEITYKYLTLTTCLLLLIVIGFSYSDILIMPTYMRKYFISYLVPKE